MRQYAMLGFALVVLCCGAPEPEKLPIMGEILVEDGDTTYHTVPQFSFLNQDSIRITRETFADGIFLADLFFTSCPTICPKVKQQMLRIHAAFPDEEKLKFLSHSIDYRRDSVPVLKRYADKLSIPRDVWHFVQLEKGQIEKYANEYFNIAMEDDRAPGGFDHSGRIMLVDREGRIRSYAEGTDPASVDKLIDDIEVLLHEI